MIYVEPYGYVTNSATLVEVFIALHAILLMMRFIFAKVVSYTLLEPYILINFREIYNHVLMYKRNNVY